MVPGKATLTDASGIAAPLLSTTLPVIFVEIWAFKAAVAASTRVYPIKRIFMILLSSLLVF